VREAAPAKDPSRISGMFDAIAGRYDLLNWILSAGLDRRWRSKAVEALQLTGTETVIDLCTGTADLALAAVNAQPRARAVIGVDFAAAMLAVGKEKAERTGQFGSAIGLVRGDAMVLPFASESMDRATIAFGIRNVERPEVACHEIARVLKPGGRLVILEFSLPRAAALRQAYLWYFRRILPVIGRMVSRHPTAYTYLPQSVEAFPSPEEFAQQIRRCGFASVEAVRLSFGVVYMFVASKGDIRAL
jgi:demethylmenaquinone methyltransferase/2-methoxy-6-polyprenyl-1,4-benzoquinol methylase